MTSWSIMVHHVVLRCQSSLQEPAKAEESWPRGHCPSWCAARRRRGRWHSALAGCDFGTGLLLQKVVKYRHFWFPSLDLSITYMLAPFLIFLGVDWSSFEVSTFRNLWWNANCSPLQLRPQGLRPCAILKRVRGQKKDTALNHKCPSWNGFQQISECKPLHLYARNILQLCHLSFYRDVQYVTSKPELKHWNLPERKCQTSLLSQAPGKNLIYRHVIWCVIVNISASKWFNKATHTKIM